MDHRAMFALRTFPEFDTEAKPKHTPTPTHEPAAGIADLFGKAQALLCDRKDLGNRALPPPFR
jgi:hypothetical protein